MDLGFNNLGQSIYCFIHNDECNSHSDCPTNISLLKHIVQCDNYFKCSIRCNAFNKYLLHYVTCSLVHCGCREIGLKEDTNELFYFIKKSLAKHQYLSWCKLVSTRRNSLLLKITNYITTYITNDTQRDYLISQIWNNLLQMDDNLYKRCSSIKDYINQFGKNCEDILRSILNRKLNLTNPNITLEEKTKYINEHLQVNDLGKIISDFAREIISLMKDSTNTAIVNRTNESTICTPVATQQEEKENTNEFRAHNLNVKKEEVKMNMTEEVSESPTTSSPVSFKPSPAVNDNVDVAPQLNNDDEINDESNYKTWSRLEIQELFAPIHLKLWNEPDAEIFHYPVDWVALKIPDYPTIVKSPIDLTTIHNQLKTGGYYNDPWQVVDDYWLMFNNAWLYNKKNSRVYRACTAISKVFETEIDELMRSIGFCCGRDYVYLPQILVCCTPNMCFVNRDQSYYSINNNCVPKIVEELGEDRYICCESCFDATRGSFVKIMKSENADTLISVPKRLFVCYKNNVKERESFIKCRHCGRKWHQVCANRMEEIWKKGFYCRSCSNKRPSHHSMTTILNNPFLAKNLPSSKVTDYLEASINRWRDCQSEHVPRIIIRLVSVSEKKTEIRPRMKTRFVDTGEMPDVLPYRLKSIYVFQEQSDDSEVCIFGIQSQEYNSQCPEPNRNRIYLAYIDSVQYFQPPQLRTNFYHRLLTDYFRWCGKLGFQWAHIWACPPADGDDYIFHIHPPYQKLPKPRRLQEWYIALLLSAVREQAIKSFDELLEHVYNRHMVSIAELPYFEGDYWPTVLEELLDETNNNNDDILNTETPNKKRKIASAQRPRRMNHSDDASEYSGKSGMNNEMLARRLFEMMEKRKENFFIIRLNNDECSNGNDSADNDPDKFGVSELMDGRDKFLALAREKHLEFGTLRRAKFATLYLCYDIHLEWRGGTIYSCDRCGLILDGYRMQCLECLEYELCGSCAQIKNVHPHTLKPIKREFTYTNSITTTTSSIKNIVKSDDKISIGYSVAASSSSAAAASRLCLTNPSTSGQPGNSKLAGMNDEGGSNSQASVQQSTLIALVQHVNKCVNDPNCSRDDCRSMKMLQKHSAVCQKSITVCRMCQRCYRINQIVRRYSIQHRQGENSSTAVVMSNNTNPRQQSYTSTTSHTTMSNNINTGNIVILSNPVNSGSQSRLRQLAYDKRRVLNVQPSSNTVVMTNATPVSDLISRNSSSSTSTGRSTITISNNAPMRPLPYSPEMEQNVKAIQQFVRHIKHVNPNLTFDQQKAQLNRFLEKNPVLDVTYQQIAFRKHQERQQRIQEQQQQQQQYSSINITPKSSNVYLTSFNNDSKSSNIILTTSRNGANTKTNSNINFSASTSNVGNASVTPASNIINNSNNTVIRSFPTYNIHANSSMSSSVPNLTPVRTQYQHSTQHQPQTSTITLGSLPSSSHILTARTSQPHHVITSTSQQQSQQQPQYITTTNVQPQQSYIINTNSYSNQQQSHQSQHQNQSYGNRSHQIILLPSSSTHVQQTSSSTQVQQTSSQQSQQYQKQYQYHKPNR